MGQPVCADRRAWLERRLSCGLLGRTHGALCVMGTPGCGAQAKPTQLLFSTLLCTSLLFRGSCSSPWDCDRCHPGAQPLFPSRCASLSPSAPEPFPTLRPHCRMPSWSWPSWCFTGLWEVKSGSPHHHHPQPPSSSSCAGGAVRACGQRRGVALEQRPSGSPTREARSLPDAPARMCVPASLCGQVGRGLAGALRAPSCCPGVRQGYRPCSFRVRCGSVIPELILWGLQLVAVTDILTATLPFCVFCVRVLEHGCGSWQTGNSLS